MRDAAAYVCWAFARAYTAHELAPSIQLLAPSLLVTACYDREVHAFGQQVLHSQHLLVSHSEYGPSCKSYSIVKHALSALSASVSCSVQRKAAKLERCMA